MTRDRINHEHLWDTSDLIPPCWPHHPHLIHDLAAVADQRRKAGTAFTSDHLEDWHRYCLPAFIDRVQTRYRGHCEDGHNPAPADARHTRYRTDAGSRAALFWADTAEPDSMAN